MSPAHDTAHGTQPAGMSRRGYARTRGVSEGAIRKHIKSGLLAPALRPDGTINPDRADALLAQGLTRSKAGAPPPSLDEARRRKLIAQVLLLHDEVQGRLDELIRPAAARATWETLIAVERPILSRLVPLAGRLAGRRAHEVRHALDEAAFALLTEVADLEVRGADADADALAPLPDLEALSLVDLTALKTDLDAARLRLVRQVNRGEWAPLRPMSSAMESCAATARQQVQSIPHRAAPLIENATKPAEARAVVERLLSDALEATTWADVEAHLGQAFTDPEDDDEGNDA